MLFAALQKKTKVTRTLPELYVKKLGLLFLSFAYALEKLGQFNVINTYALPNIAKSELVNIKDLCLRTVFHSICLCKHIT